MKTRLLKQVRKRFEILKIDKIDKKELTLEDRMKVREFDIPFYVVYDSDWNTKYFHQNLPKAQFFLMQLIKEYYSHNRKLQGLKSRRSFY